MHDAAFRAFETWLANTPRVVFTALFTRLLLVFFPAFVAR